MKTNEELPDQQNDEQNENLGVEETPQTTIPQHIEYPEKYPFLGEEFLNNSDKIFLFDEAIKTIKANIVTPNKSSKASFAYVMYKLIFHGKITNLEQLTNELNEYMQYVNVNFNNYSQSIGKFTLSHKFYKFSNNYLLEKLKDEQ